MNDVGFTIVNRSDFIACRFGQPLIVYTVTLSRCCDMVYRDEIRESRDILCHRDTRPCLHASKFRRVSISHASAVKVMLSDSHADLYRSIINLKLAISTALG